MGIHLRANLKLFTFVIGLLLVFWAARLIAIDHFPMFTDEAFHIRFARNVVEKGVFSNAEEGRQFTIWLYVLAGADQNAAIFSSRAMTLLVLLPGLAALIASGALLAGRAGSRAGYMGAVFTGLLVMFSPYHTFFERLALADPVSASALSVALYFTARLVRRAVLRDALLAGGMLFVAFGAKVSALPLLMLPVAGALFLRPPGRTWRQSWRWAAVAIGTAGVLIALFVAVLLWRQHDPFFYLLRGTGQAGSSGGMIALLLERIPRNLQSIYTNISGFIGLPALLLAGAALLVLLVRRQWFLPVLLLGSVAIFLLNNRPDTRHLIIPVNIGVLIVAVALALLVEKRPYALRFGVTVALAGFSLLNWLPFVQAMNTDPAALNIPWNDYHQYIASEASGTGLDEVAEFLQAQNPQQVIGVLANCWALEYMTQGDLPILCPPINPNGSDVEALAALLHDSQGPGVYAVLEDIAYVPAEAPGRIIATVERPAGGARLRIYELSADTG